MNKLIVFLLVIFALTFTPQAQAASSFFSFPSLPSFPFPSINPLPSKNPLPSNNPLPSSFPNPSFFPSPSKTPNPSLALGLIDPATANFAQTITLKGTGFGATQGSVIFFLRNSDVMEAEAPIVSWSDTEIKALVPALAGNNYYDVAVERSNNTLTNKLRIRVKYGQPQISSISIIRTNQGVTLQLGGTEFGFSKGKVNFYNSSNTLVGTGNITRWSDSKVYLTVPAGLPSAEYSYQIQTSDGRLSTIHYLNI